MINALASEEVAVVATIDPDVTTASTVVSDYVDMQDWGKIMAIVMAGTLGSSATLNAKLVEATASDGTGAQDISGKAITALTQAGTDSDKQAIINCRADELDLADGYRYVALSLTVAVASSDAGAIILGLEPKIGTAADNDLASVDEIVS